jgi:hypothetical protein
VVLLSGGSPRGRKYQHNTVSDIASCLAVLSLVRKLIHVTSNHFSMSLCDCCSTPAHLWVSGGGKSSTYFHLTMFQFHKYTFCSPHCWLASFTFSVNHCLHWPYTFQHLSALEFLDISTLEDVTLSQNVRQELPNNMVPHSRTQGIWTAPLKKPRNFHSSSQHHQFSQWHPHFPTLHTIFSAQFTLVPGNGGSRLLQNTIFKCRITTQAWVMKTLWLYKNVQK